MRAGVHGPEQRKNLRVEPRVPDAKAERGAKGEDRCAARPLAARPAALRLRCGCQYDCAL